jgi:hypothetical protein
MTITPAGKPPRQQRRQFRVRVLMLSCVVCGAEFGQMSGRQSDTCSYRCRGLRQAELNRQRRFEEEQSVAIVRDAVSSGDSRQ